MSQEGDDPRVRLAAERTLLAWIRTGLALMGFGFVVARFGLFLHELAEIEQADRGSEGWSSWIGTALVALGVIVTVLAAEQHRRFLKRLDCGEPYVSSRWSLGLLVAAMLVVIGVGMVGYLMTR